MIRTTLRNAAKLAGAATVALVGAYGVVATNENLERKVDAWLFDKTLTAYNELASVRKAIHLAPLREAVAIADPKLREEGKFRLLDVGCGTGVNAPFYPKNALLTGIDPNEAFEEYFRRRMARSRIEVEKHIIGRAENMDAVQSDSMDAVVTTMTLCHADDGVKFLDEIKRVLAPGGKYYFWEHIHAFGDRHYPGYDVQRQQEGHKNGKHHKDHHHHHEHHKKHDKERSLNKNILFIIRLLIGRRERKYSDDEVPLYMPVSAEEKLIRGAGFSHVVCSTFFLKDEVPEDEVEQFGWFTRRCFECFKDKAHIRGIAVK